MNCSGISPELCARELFGYEDAHGKQRGRVELAAGGTLYIEDITALPLQMQARLVALLEDHLYLREGGYRYIPGRARVIAATSCDPYDKMREGRLREDLFFRLNVVPLFVPPLRKRPGAIRPLANHFARKFGVEGGIDELIGSGRWPKMENYEWPGNVTELEGEVRLAVLRAGQLHTSAPWDDDEDL